MLEPFQFEECEYSAQVRLKMSEWRIDCILIQREVPACKGGGVSKVPRLPVDCDA